MLTTEISPYLQGNFAPVQAEIVADNLPVVGELPRNLSGMIVRNGPNPKFSPLSRYSWYDGDGMLHGVQISNGKAAYRNRYVQTQGLQREENAGRALWTGLMEPPQMSIPANNPFTPFKNTANTALVRHAGRLLALWEGAEPYEISLPDLETIGSYLYNNTLTSPITAHPKIDAVTGEMMFFGYSLLEPPHLRYSIISAQGNLIQTVPIELPIGVMMHDFAITKHYTLFIDLPLTFRLERLRRREPAYMFEPDLSSRIGILPRYGDSSSIRWFEVSTCYVVHTLNAYETGEEVVLVACRAKDAKGLDMPTKSGFRSYMSGDRADRPCLYRWRFNLHTGKVREEAIDDIGSEFPTLNQQCVGRQNRYGYAARMVPGQIPMFTFDGVLKYDLTNHCSQLHQWGSNRYGGEAVFVPCPDAAEEDEGWLLTFVYDAAKQASELVVVDAQNLESEPLARILLPQRVPYGFHGTWISDCSI